jgi:hypothetical protein
MNKSPYQSVIEILKSDDILVSDKETLVRRFFVKHLGLTYNESNFEKARDAYVSQDAIFNDRKKIPTNFEKLIDDIYFRYFRMQNSPNEVFIQLYLHCSRQLIAINDNIYQLEKEIKELKAQKPSSNSFYDINFKLDFSHYLLGENKETRKEIMQFISNHNEVKRHVVGLCRADFFRFKEGTPYDYFYTVDFLEPRYPDVLFNKFLHSRKDQADKSTTLKLFQEGKFEELADFLKDYITTEKVMETIHTSVEFNHMLFSRKEMIYKVLEDYKKEDYLSSVHLIPPIIEGLIHDMCLEYGTPELEIHNKGLKEKMNILRKHQTMMIYDFDYYGFVFRYYRNRLMHGGKIEDKENIYLPFLFVLDLFFFCNKMVRNIELPVNEKLDILNKLPNARRLVSSNHYDLLCNFLSLPIRDIPDMYKREKDLEEFKKDLENNTGFHQHLKDHIKWGFYSEENLKHIFKHIDYLTGKNTTKTLKSLLSKKVKSHKKTQTDIN